MTTRRIRYSQLAKFKRCRRSWQLEDVDGMELDRDPTQSKGSRSLGTLVHVGVEHLNNGLDWRAGLDAEKAKVEEAGGWSDDWYENFNMARIMLEGYEEWVATTGADANEQVLLVEPQLEANMGIIHGDEVILTGQPDAVKRDTLTGLVIVEDTKTVTTLDQVMIHGAQGLTYAMLLKLQHGIDVDVFRTNQLKKVKRSARAKPPFYGRPEMFVNKTRLRHHWSHVMGQLDEMVALVQSYEEGGYSDRTAYDRKFYPNPTKDCSWDCDFLPVCSLMDDGSHFEHALEIHYRKKPETPLK